MAAWFVEKFCIADRQKSLKHGLQTRGWVTGFLSRRAELRVVALRFVEEKRVAAITEARVAEQIARVKAVLKRYHINKASHIFNIDECGVSFDKMNCRSLRRGVAHASVSRAMHFATIRTRGNLNHVTVMAVISADGKEYKLFLVSPGKLPHYRRLE